MIALKVPAWALAIFVLGLFGIIMINLFGNITVTDQLNYTTMKNAVEASMYDAIDKGYYSTGFCICTNNSKVSSKWSFNDDSEYDLVDITYENGREKCVSSKRNCEILHGEYRINKVSFSESLIRRFAEMVNNNKEYEILIQDIIEYPPKVSIRISSKDKEYSPTDKNGGGYSIVNQIDAILESKGVSSTISNPTTDEATTPPNAFNNQETLSTYSPNNDREGCYYKESTWTYCWGTAASCGFGYRYEGLVNKKEKCKNVCFCQKNGDKCGVWADRPDDPDWFNYEYANLIDGECKRQKEETEKSCKWYAVSHEAYCEKGSVVGSMPCKVKTGPYKDEKSALRATTELTDIARTKCSCKNTKSGYSPVRNIGYVYAVKKYNVNSEYGIPVCLDIYAKDEASAVAACKECSGRSCTATCS